MRGKSNLTASSILIFSNAALHWVDDHQTILRGMASVLKPGGRLIVSCGGKGNAQDVFVALRPEMRLKRWRRIISAGCPSRIFFSSPADYEKWLPKFGFKITQRSSLRRRTRLTPARTVLPHGCARPGCLMSSACRKICARNSSPPSRSRYVAKHPPDAEGKVHVRMVRLEIDAQKL